MEEVPAGRETQQGAGGVACGVRFERTVGVRAQGGAQRALPLRLGPEILELLRCALTGGSATTERMRRGAAGRRSRREENVYAFMTSKGSAWEYEQEWRLITALSKIQQSGRKIAVVTAPQESVSSILITDRTLKDTVNRIVRRLNNPSNGYRIWWIDKMQRGHDATTLAFVGQIKSRAQPSIRTA